ncbi:MAG: class I SAM-dependent methyltransferase [Actinomycetota bacterium]
MNLFADSVILPNFSCQIGDARTMPQFENGQFDLVFSNSVIEHVGDLSDQKRMGQEIRRVGKRYFVQTPNRRFPIEPHFMFPLFQFFPEPLKVFLICHLPITHAKTRWTREQALEVARDIRLLTHRELRMIFPHATIRRERVLGLSKSFMVYEGWPTDGIRRSR